MLAYITGTVDQELLLRNGLLGSVDLGFRLDTMGELYRRSEGARRARDCDLNYTSALRKIPAEKLIHDVVGADGGPLIYNGSEEEQRSLDSTCRKLHRFLNQPQR
jgi:hypothetical protein